MKKVLAELFALDNLTDVLFIIVGWWDLSLVGEGG
jgi:hypothetical protein